MIKINEERKEPYLNTEGKKVSEEVKNPETAPQAEEAKAEAGATAEAEAGAEAAAGAKAEETAESKAAEAGAGAEATAEAQAEETAESKAAEAGATAESKEAEAGATAESKSVEAGAAESKAAEAGAAESKAAEAEAEGKDEAEAKAAETEAKTEAGAEADTEESAKETEEAGKEPDMIFGNRKLKKELEKKDEIIKEQNDKYIRLMAEFDNYRKRTEKEKSGMYAMGAKDIVEKILPVVDNFERGFSLVTPEDAEDPFTEGMQKIYKQLMTTLTDLGVTPIEAVGKEFDPNLHNAVMHVEDESVGENIIVQEFQKGYMYKDSVVRHSMVQVAN